MLNTQTNDENIYGRKLSQGFIDDLKHGILNQLLARIQNDYTLTLAIRNEYINVYYRGGSLLKVQRNLKKGFYKVEFDNNYLTDEQIDLKQFVQENARIESEQHTQDWITQLPLLKQAMDLKFASKGSDEREFQQLIFRENNISRLSNNTEYFFSDIEYSPEAIKSLGLKQFRFDMLGVEWLASQRKDGKSCRPVIMEIKYGDNAFNGTSGIKVHLDDIATFLKHKKSELIPQINGHMQQLRDLGLVSLGHGDHEQLENNTKQTVKNRHPIDIQMDAKPIVIFVFANTNPRSSKLFNLMEGLAQEIENHQQDFDVRFFVANFCGYAMHHINLLDVQQFQALLNILQEKKLEGKKK